MKCKVECQLGEALVGLSGILRAVHQVPWLLKGRLQVQWAQTVLEGLEDAVNGCKLSQRLERAFIIQLKKFKGSNFLKRWALSSERFNFAMCNVDGFIEEGSVAERCD